MTMNCSYMKILEVIWFHIRFSWTELHFKVLDIEKYVQRCSYWRNIQLNTLHSFWAKSSISIPFRHSLAENLMFYFKRNINTIFHVGGTWQVTGTTRNKQFCYKDKMFIALTANTIMLLILTEFLYCLNCFNCFDVIKWIKLLAYS